MKKLLLLLLALVVAFSLIACDETNKASDSDDDDEEEESTVTTTESGGTDGSVDDGEDVNKPGDGESTSGSDDPGTTSSDKPGTTSSDTPGTASSDNTSGSFGDDDKPTDNPGTTSSNNPGTTDSTGNVGEEDNPTDNPTDKPTVPEGAGLALTQAVISQLEKAASMKLEFTLDMVVDTLKWTPNGSVSESERGTGLVVVTISKGTNGYNMIVEVDLRSTEDGGDELLIDNQGVLLCIIDGVAYTYDESIDKYIAEKIQDIDMSELEGAFDQLIGDVEISEEEMNALLDDLGAMVISALKIENGHGSAYIDYKVMYDQLIAYINDLDLAKDTIRILLDEAFALIDPTMTVDAIVQSVAATMGMTVGDFIAHFEQTYGMTMQQMYDALANDPQVQALIIAMVAPEDATDEEIAAFLERVTTTKVDSLFTEDVKKLTMYEFALMLFEVDMSTQPPTLDELVTFINAVLDMPLQELEAQFGVPFSFVKLIPSLITLREYNTKLDVTFKNFFDIDEITLEERVDITVSVPSELVDGKMDVYTVAGSVSFKLYEISDKAVDISMPKDAVIVERQTFNYDLSVSNMRVEYELTVDDANDGYLTLYMNAVVYVDGEMADVNDFVAYISSDCVQENVIYAPANSFVNIDTEQPDKNAMTLVLDYENGTFVIQ